MVASGLLILWSSVPMNSRFICSILFKSVASSTSTISPSFPGASPVLSTEQLRLFSAMVSTTCCCWAFPECTWRTLSLRTSKFLIMSMKSALSRLSTPTSSSLMERSLHKLIRKSALNTIIPRGKRSMKRSRSLCPLSILCSFIPYPVQLFFQALPRVPAARTASRRNPRRLFQRPSPCRWSIPAR